MGRESVRWVQNDKSSDKAERTDEVYRVRKGRQTTGEHQLLLMIAEKRCIPSRTLAGRGREGGMAIAFRADGSDSVGASGLASSNHSDSGSASDAAGLVRADLADVADCASGQDY
jgi:hypothetical protein